MRFKGKDGDPVGQRSTPFREFPVGARGMAARLEISSPEPSEERREPSRTVPGSPVTERGCCWTPGKAALREEAVNRGGNTGFSRPLADRPEVFCFS